MSFLSVGGRGLRPARPVRRRTACCVTRLARSEPQVPSPPTGQHGDRRDRPGRRCEGPGREAHGPAGIFLRLCLAVLLTSFWPGTRLSAQSDGTPAGSLSDGRETPLLGGGSRWVRVETLDGEVLDGELVELTGRGAVVSESARKRRFVSRDLLRIRFSDQPVPGASVPSVYLVNGDRVFGQPYEIQDEQLLVRWTLSDGARTVAVPLETVRLFLLAPFYTGGKVPRPIWAERLRDPLDPTRVVRPVDGKDVALLYNGDRIEGELLGWNGREFSFRTPVGPASVVTSRVVGVALNPQWSSFPDVPAEHQVVLLRDGSRHTTTTLRLDARGRLQLTLAFGGQLTVARRDLVSAQFFGDRAVYLSDLQPVRFRHTPFLSGHWPLERDANVLGGGLRLRGRQFVKGLGVHSRSEVTYDLNGRFARFHAVAGLDDVAEADAAADFAVQVDGRTLWKRTLRRTDPPASTGWLKVESAKRLTLLVDFGPHADIQDRADWCDALLVRP